MNDKETLEPVAFINVEQRKLEWAKYMSWDTPTVVNLPKIPLYTTPPQHSAIARTAAVGEDTRRAWVGLTDEEIDEWTPEIHVVIRAIEAKLKEKNTDA